MSTETSPLTSLLRRFSPPEETPDMAKYLRAIAVHVGDEDGSRDEAIASALSAAAGVRHLSWMYEHYATPAVTDGVAKINIHLNANHVSHAPSEVLGIASVVEGFEAERFSGLGETEQRLYYLQRIHSGVTRCAAHFGWSPEPFVAAYERIVREEFQFSFYWKKPISSPDRQWKASALVQVSPLPGRLYLVFLDSRQREVRRVLLSAGVNGPGIVEFLLGKIRWEDQRTVRVEHQNGRDYWLCPVDGPWQFHYPRAERGDPHGSFELGRMYFEGRYVLRDQPRGLELIKFAADRGFKHAQNFLASVSSDDVK